jgi:hypothetical protein
MRERGRKWEKWEVARDDERSLIDILPFGMGRGKGREV